MSALKLFPHRGRKALRRLYSGPLGTYIDPIAAWYFDHGYERSYASASVKWVDRFGRWVHRQGLQLCDINEQLIDRYLLLRMSPRSHCGARVALRRLLAVLREGGASPPPVVERGPVEILEDDFRRYLVEERGLAARTVEHYTEAARVFVTALFKQGRQDPSKWTAADVLIFVRQHSRMRSPVYMQHLCIGLRSFLRYLRFRGKLRRELASSVPRIAHWRLGTLPKYLSSKQVERVLGYCDRHTVIGRRNYAVLMLLTRLGLRADEVRSLSLDDVDWQSGLLTIRGKGRPPEPMPLPQDVGTALAAYLTNGRPPSTSRAVFVRMMAPHTEFPSSGAITDMVAKALHAAGVDAPIKGAHVFRHSLATQMLNDGASLREIGQVLRHGDEDTTRIYAKVDLRRLRALTLRWPGGVS